MTQGVEFSADGKTYRLRYGMNALVRYQEAAGETIQAAVTALEGGQMDAVRVRRLFWAGIPGITEEEAGDLIDVVGLQTASEHMGEALRAAFGDAANPPRRRKAK